VVSAI